MRLPRLVLVSIIACSKPPPPKPPAAEKPVAAVADIAGRWAANDDLDWGYDDDRCRGVIDVWIDRAKMGRCQQLGKIVAAKTERVFTVTYSRGECNPEAVGMPIEMTIASFNGDSMTVVVGDQRRIYARSN